MENSRKGKKTGDWLLAFAVVVLFFAVYRATQSAGWLKGIDVQKENVTLGVSFLIGIVASLSTCLAVVGSMVIAFGEKYDSESENFSSGVIRPNLFFHIGRIATFFLLGGLLGKIGGTINISGNFVSVYTIIIAVAMGWLGLSILGILPSISALGFRPPKFFTKCWARIESSERKAAPFFLGGLTFFLPCGFTQSMQILALASGNFWSGASVLFVFALGTAPVLLLLGVTASWGRVKKLEFIQKAAGVLILIFAVFTLKSGLALKNVRTNVVSSDLAKRDDNLAEKSSGTMPDKFQTVEMRVTNRGFEPNILIAKAGLPVRWVIKGDQVSGCTSQIVMPSFEISRKIGYGENIISFTPMNKGEIAFSCGMGMVRGKFIVQ